MVQLLHCWSPLLLWTNVNRPPWCTLMYSACRRGQWRHSKPLGANPSFCADMLTLKVRAWNLSCTNLATMFCMQIGSCSNTAPQLSPQIWLSCSAFRCQVTSISTTVSLFMCLLQLFLWEVEFWFRNSADYDHHSLSRLLGLTLTGDTCEQGESWLRYDFALSSPTGE